MAYKVHYSKLAEEQMDRIISYILYKLKNYQAAVNVMNDAEETVEELSVVAKNLEFCRDPELHEKGYRSIHFKRHRYHMVYQIEREKVEIKGIYHDLQDVDHTIC